MSTHNFLQVKLRELLHVYQSSSLVTDIAQKNKNKAKRAKPSTRMFAKVMLKYGVTHRFSTAYHPQTSGQVEVSNRGLKRILERTVGENRASWSDKLDDALWAFQHKAYWALKHRNFDLKTAGDHRKVQMNELNKLHDLAYENSLIYKEKTKKIHDSKIKNRVFNVGDRVLLFNSRLKIFLGKLKTRWTGPFTVAQIFPYGTVELSSTNGPKFKVTNIAQKDKNKAKRTKLGTRMERVQEIEAEGKFIQNPIPLNLYPKRNPKTIASLVPGYLHSLFKEIPRIDGSWWKSVHPSLSGSSQGNGEMRSMTASCDTPGMYNLTMSKTRSTCSWASSFLFPEKVSSLNSRMN
ncbi:reverse transcriptase domain-containing protein [Tanacetum coccineum]